MSNVVKKVITPTALGHFHDLDPYKLFPTKQDAEKDRSQFASLKWKKKSRSPRVSTFYTILMDPRKNNPRKFGSVPQGPHTFPHHAIQTAIIKAKEQNKLSAFAPLIPSPKKYASLVDKEIPSGHPKRERAELANVIYKKRHDRFKKLEDLGKKARRSQVVAYAHVINKLIQMHPHGSYAYKGKGAGKKALAGKGESRKRRLAEQISFPSASGFNDSEAAKTRLKRILATLKKKLRME